MQFQNPFKTTPKTILFSTILVVGLFSCQEEGKDIEINKEPVISTFYLIRHAEKDRSDETNPDPELTQKGMDRAIRWAEVFDNIALDMIYSTDYERTSMTAAPTSVKKELPISFYDPDTLDVDTFRKNHIGLNILIVGHSNTTPELANALLDEEKYDQLYDDDNASLFIIRMVDSLATDIKLNLD